MHACMHTYIHTYIHTYTHTYMHAYIHTHTYIHVRMSRCVYLHVPGRGRGRSLKQISKQSDSLCLLKQLNKKQRTTQRTTYNKTTNDKLSLRAKQRKTNNIHKTNKRNALTCKTTNNTQQPKKDEDAAWLLDLGYEAAAVREALHSLSRSLSLSLSLYIYIYMYINIYYNIYIYIYTLV